MNDKHYYQEEEKEEEEEEEERCGKDVERQHLTKVLSGYPLNIQQSALKLDMCVCVWVNYYLSACARAIYIYICIVIE